MSLLEVNNLNFSYKDKLVLDNISFAIDPQEVVTVIGPNGSGKSTLVKLIIGTLKAQSGHILYKDGVKIGYMPQNIHISKMIPITVKDFLKLFIADFQFSCRKTLQFLKVDILLDNQLSMLSGGQIQRVLLAAALIDRPNFLILDEPLQAIDHSGQVEFYSLINHLRLEHNLTIMLVSHDLNTVMAKTDKVLCINKHICCYGKPKELSENNEFLSLFKSNDIVNFALYEHNHKHD